ncbi:MAG: ATP-dependent DNA helicase [Pseudomonas sp.]
MHLLTQDQQAAEAAFLAFMMSDEPEMVISGPAGTGKTTLLRHLMAQQDNVKLANLVGSRPITEWRLTATTNKAAEVLGTTSGTEASTIHSALGLKVINDFKTGKARVTKTKDSLILSRKLIVIDECSMIDTPLKKLIGEGTIDCKILYVGDHCQLAPVMESISPVFATLEPVELKEIVRSKGAPAITTLANQLRQMVETGVFTEIQPVPGVIEYLTPEEAMAEVQRVFVDEESTLDARILCYTNRRVLGYNSHIRQLRNLPGHITEGEHLVSNTMSQGIAPSGKVFRTHVEQELHVEEVGLTVSSRAFGQAKLDCYDVYALGGTRFTVPVDMEEYQALVRHATNQKDWITYFSLKEWVADFRPADASTVYKAQGSTYRDVFVDLSDIGTCTNASQAARMLYVACSRPTDRIYFIGQLPGRLRGA